MPDAKGIMNTVESSTLRSLMAEHSVVLHHGSLNVILINVYFFLIVKTSTQVSKIPEMSQNTLLYAVENSSVNNSLKWGHLVFRQIKL